MDELKRFLTFRFAPSSRDLGLLFLRAAGGLCLFLKHGMSKFEHRTAAVGHAPNLFHLGTHVTFIFPYLSDVISSILVTLGLCTRWAALVVVVDVFAAWSMVHHFVFFGAKGDHGELIVLYLALYGSLIFSGAGRYSLDHLLGA